MQAVPNARAVDAEVAEALSEQFALRVAMTEGTEDLADLYRRSGRRYARSRGWKIRTIMVGAGHERVLHLVVTDVDAASVERYEARLVSQTRAAVQAAAAAPDVTGSARPGGPHLRSV